MYWSRNIFWQMEREGRESLLPSGQAPPDWLWVWRGWWSLVRVQSWIRRNSGRCNACLGWQWHQIPVYWGAESVAFSGCSLGYYWRCITQGRWEWKILRIEIFTRKTGIPFVGKCSTVGLPQATGSTQSSMVSECTTSARQNEIWFFPRRRPESDCGGSDRHTQGWTIGAPWLCLYQNCQGSPSVWMGKKWCDVWSSIAVLLVQI